MSTTITWTNKDLISKILADTFGAGSFRVYGVNLPPIAEYLPTELPTIEATDRMTDRLFRLTDGSYLLVDFESAYKQKNFIKYLQYISRILTKYLTEAHPIRLRLLVIFTGDVYSAPAVFRTDCVTLRVEQAYLSHIDGDVEYDRLLKKISAGIRLTEEDQMKLILLPLTYPDKNRKIEMIDTVVDAVTMISEDEQKRFLLAGLCVTANKYITELQTDRIEVMLRMTKVGQKIYNDWKKQTISYGNEREQQGINRVAQNMLRHGYDEASVMEMTGLTQAQLDGLLERNPEPH